MRKKILILASNPSSSNRLRLDKEVREIDEGLRRSKHRDKFEITHRGALRLNDLRRALLDEAPHIIHFCGHGEQNGIWLESDYGEAIFVNPEALSDLFNILMYDIECVVLNACYSKAQADAMSRQIPYIVSLDDEIGDRAAIEFSIGFYDGLGAGKSIETAFKLGCNAIRLKDYPSQLIPVLKKKKSKSSSSRQEIPVHTNPKVEIKPEVSLGEIEITIDSELEPFSQFDQDELLKAIKSLLGISNGIQVISKRRGSVKLKLSLPYELAERLFWAIKQGALLDYGVTNAQLIGKATADAILETKINNGAFDVLLCYNREDKTEIIKIGQKLKNFGVLPWLDEWDIRPGLSWQKTLESQIESIKSAAVFIGCNGIGPWQDMEIQAFIRQFVKRGCPVIPVLLRNCTTIPKLPTFLEGMGYVDLRKRKPDPVEQLVWGITGNKINPT